MRQVALAEVKDDLLRFLRLAESEEIVITRQGKPAGVLIGFASGEDWFDYRLEHHPRVFAVCGAGAGCLKGWARSSIGRTAVVTANFKHRFPNRSSATTPI